VKKIFGPGWFALFTAPLLFVFSTVVLIPFFIKGVASGAVK